MVNFNGKLLPKESNFLNHGNRAIKYGDCVFETLRAHRGTVLFLEDHYLRLMASMRILRMEIPMDFTMEYMEEQIGHTLAANRLQDAPARIRFTVFRNNGGYYLPETNTISYTIEAFPLDSEKFIWSSAPYEVELFKDHYVNADLLSTLKTNNRLINVTGSIYARENGYQNCLLLNQFKNVVEALNGNLFLVTGDHIKTPPLKDGCLNGIIRKQLLNMLKRGGKYILEETSVSPFELRKADELFITNTMCGLQPVTKYRKADFGHDVAADLLGKLNERAGLT
ncbi:MAG TPA: aminotransferase class IV [Eudoraea sp.]|nr:aminotransferase class IV [Eudoraea sp.]